MSTFIKLQIATDADTMDLDDVTMVTVPGIDGQLGILPGHAPLITPIAPGEVIIERAGSEQLLAVGEGMIEVTMSRVVLLTDMAIPVEELDDRKAQDELAREQEKLKMKLSEKEYAAVAGNVARLVAQVTTLRDFRKS